jgi:hypothetical protein
LHWPTSKCYRSRATARRRRAAILVAAVALVAFGVASSRAGGSSTSGGCFPPSLAVDIWAFSLDELHTGMSLGGPESRAEDCETICNKWRKTCGSIADIAKRCNASTAGKFASHFATQCKTLDDPADQKDCKGASKQLKTILKDCAKQDAELGKSCCESYAPFCLQGCLAASPAPLPTPGCFTDLGPNPSCYAEFIN